MTDPLSVIIPTLDPNIIDAERLQVNLFRFSVDFDKFQLIIKSIRENSFDLRAIHCCKLIEKNDGQDETYELQYIFSKLFDYRDYQLILTLKLGSAEVKLVPSITELFFNASLSERKLSTNFPIKFI